MTRTVKDSSKVESRVIYQLSYGNFLVESSDKMKLYKVSCNGNQSCTCPDYRERCKANAKYQCKHIQAVLKSDKYSIVNIDNKSSKPKLAEEFIKKIDGRDFVIYAGLLDLAHQQGLQSIEVELLQLPSDDVNQLAICKAIAITTAGERFIDYGDASPQNCNAKVARHLIRMASTRAKARVLRDFTNIGMTCLEELGGPNETIPEDISTQSRQSTSTTPTVASVSEAQKNAIRQLANRNGITGDQLSKLIATHCDTSFDTLTSSQAASLINHLQNQ